MKSAPKSSQQLVQVAYDRIEAAIVFGDFKPRQRLIERELERQLNVSRTPIREALRRLESAGLITNEPNRGAIVVDFKPKDIEDIYVVRIGLEQLALNLIRPFTPREALGLEKAARDLEGAYAVRDFRGVVRLNTEFHRQLLAPVESPMLLAELNRFMAKTCIVRNFFSLGFWSDPAAPAVSIKEHRAMIGAVKSENWAKLRALMLGHTLRPINEYLRRFNVDSCDAARLGMSLDRAVRLMSGNSVGCAALDDVISAKRRTPGRKAAAAVRRDPKLATAYAR